MTNPFAAMTQQLTTTKADPRDLKSGDVFERLTLTGSYRLNAWGGRMYHAICNCGNAGWFRKAMLVSGQTKSCGCWRRDPARKIQPLACAAAALKCQRDPVTQQFTRRVQS